MAQPENSFDPKLLTEQGYFITTDKTKIDFDLVYNYLSKESYWSENIPAELVKRSIENSVCFSVFFK